MMAQHNSFSILKFEENIVITFNLNLSKESKVGSPIGEEAIFYAAVCLRKVNYLMGGRQGKGAAAEYMARNLPRVRFVRFLMCQSVL